MRSCKIICCTELTKIRFEGSYPLLTDLNFGNVPELCSPLDLSIFPRLTNCNFEGLENLPLACSGVFPLLKFLDFNIVRGIRTLNLSHFPLLEVCSLSAMDDLQELTCEGEHACLEKLYLWAIPNLQKLNLSFYKNLKSCILSKLIGLRQLECHEPLLSLTQLRLDARLPLGWWEPDPNYALDTLDLSNYPNLEEFHLEGSPDQPFVKLICRNPLEHLERVRILFGFSRGRELHESVASMFKLNVISLNQLLFDIKRKQAPLRR